MKPKKNDGWVFKYSVWIHSGLGEIQQWGSGEWYFYPKGKRLIIQGPHKTLKQAKSFAEKKEK